MQTFNTPLAKAKTMLKAATKADKLGKNPEMRARNHDQILSWIEDRDITWSQLNISSKAFEVLLLRMIERCPECNTNDLFMLWIKSDLQRRFFNIEHKLSQRGNPMGTPVPLDIAA